MGKANAKVREEHRDQRSIATNLQATFKDRRRKVDNITLDNIPEYRTARFARLFNRNVYVASGSTFEKEGEYRTGALEVLDACQITPIISPEGDRCQGFIMATADGYDHYEPHEIAAAAVEACDQFTTRASEKVADRHEPRNNNITSILDFAGQSCAIAKKTAKESSLAGTLIRGKGNKPTFSCEMGNVGDGMIIVIDGKQSQVKAVVGARQYFRKMDSPETLKLTQAECLSIARQGELPPDFEGTFFLPRSFQDSRQTIAEEEIVLNSGDVVIHMTDGMWGCFKYHDAYFMKKGDGAIEITSEEADAKEEGADKREYVLYRENKIDCEKFEAILRAEECKNSFEIGQALLNAALLTYATHQTYKKKLLNWLEEKLQAECKKHLEKEHEDALEEKKEEKELHARAQAGRELLINFLQEIPEDEKKYLNRFRKYQRIKEDSSITLNEIIRILRAPAGDCSTMVVVEVPNIAVENLRPFFERVTDKVRSEKVYYGIKESTAELRTAEEKWRERLENHGKDKKEFYRALIEHLRNEKFLREPAEKGYEKGDVYKNLCPFYTADEIKILTEDLIEIYMELGKNQLLYSVNDPLAKKKEKQQALKKFLKTHCKSVHEKAIIFYFLQSILSYNTHTNARWDRFFGLHNTKSWRETVKEIRLEALEQLKKECDALESVGEKIAFLENARKMPIFSYHRNNYRFFGAFGRTQAQITIDNYQCTIKLPALANSSGGLERVSF
ncbi:MAG: hypothetical protein K0S27_929 [Gammaproteobacteria bacterium]|jgi:hypothetical protein|nr:hypothetical protein [Gammaproteobacteria bacterium]